MTIIILKWILWTKIIFYKIFFIKMNSIQKNPNKLKYLKAFGVGEKYKAKYACIFFYFLLLSCLTSTLISFLVVLSFQSFIPEPYLGPSHQWPMMLGLGQNVVCWNIMICPYISSQCHKLNSYQVHQLL